MLLPDTTDLIRLTLHKDQAWALGVIVAGAVAILTQGAVFVRLARIAASSQMAGGWFDATAFILAPAGYKWEDATQRYEKRQKNRDGGYDLVGVVTREQCRELWRADRAAMEAAA